MKSAAVHEQQRPHAPLVPYASARAAVPSERTTAALSAVLLTRKLIAEAQAIEETHGSETAKVNSDQFRKLVEDQLRQANPEIAEWWDAQRKAVADFFEQHWNAQKRAVEEAQNAIGGMFRPKP